MTIETANIKDVPELLELQYKAFGPICKLLNWEDAPNMKETVEQAAEEFPKYLTLKVCDGDSHIIGSVRGNVTDGSLFIGRLMVLPEHQGKGLGKALLREIQARMKHSRTWLCTCKEVDSSYTLYEREGFTTYATEPVSEGISWAYMEKYSYMETERILLRPWLDSDAKALFKYASDPDVGPRAGWPVHQSIDESLEVIQNIFRNDTTWAIVLKETSEPIGCMGYFTHATSNIPIGENDCEVGYWVGKPYWNKGICTEALQLMLDYCIDIKHFENIWSDHFIGNPASGRVMEKCGFKDTGKLNRCSNLLGGDKDMVKIYKLDNGIRFTPMEIKK